MKATHHLKELSKLRVSSSEPTVALPLVHHVPQAGRLLLPQHPHPDSELAMFSILSKRQGG